VRLEFIEATACEECEPSDSGVPRCKRCRSKGEANILLGPDGYCPVCGMNSYGEHIDARDLRAMFHNDPELYDHMILAPAERNHVRNHGGASKDVIISYAGQRHRHRMSQAQFRTAQEAIRFRRLLGGK